MQGAAHEHARRVYVGDLEQSQPRAEDHRIALTDTHATDADRVALRNEPRPAAGGDALRLLVDRNRLYCVVCRTVDNLPQEGLAVAPLGVLVQHAATALGVHALLLRWGNRQIAPCTPGSR